MRAPAHDVRAILPEIAFLRQPVGYGVVRLEANIAELEQATRRNFHMPRLFLDNHRFYLDAAQCYRINAAIEKIEASPYIGNLIYFSVFVPDDRLTSDYLI